VSREEHDLRAAWHLLVGVVMDTRGDWRRNVTAATGLPFTRVRALKRLRGGPLTLGALAESLGTDAPAATVAVNDLERRGLVTRLVHPEDRRAKLVSLTPAGRAVLRTVRRVVDEPPASFRSLSVDEVGLLLRVFERAAGEDLAGAGLSNGRTSVDRRRTSSRRRSHPG
jgi:DNA-binding MarR family transcriptional regulator